MIRYVGLDVSQKLTAICVVDETARRLWRGQCSTDPEQIDRTIRGRAGDAAPVGLETGPMTPWLVHELRGRKINITCLDARHARAALKMPINMLFCLAEIEMGRAVSARIQDFGTRAGLAVMVTLFMVTTIHDLDQAGLFRWLSLR